MMTWHIFCSTQVTVHCVCTVLEYGDVYPTMQYYTVRDTMSSQRTLQYCHPECLQDNTTSLHHYCDITPYHWGKVGLFWQKGNCDKFHFEQLSSLKFLHQSNSHSVIVKVDIYMYSTHFDSRSNYSFDSVIKAVMQKWCLKFTKQENMLSKHHKSTYLLTVG